LLGVPVNIDTAFEAPRGETAVQFMVVIERIRPRTHWLRPPEVESEPGAHALDPRVHPLTIEDALQTAIERVAGCIDLIENSGLSQLIERGDGSKHAQQVTRVGAAVDHWPRRRELQHQVL